MGEELHWAEKYRPKSLDEVVGHDKIVETLKMYIKHNSIPHLIFNGPAGTGKNSTAYAMINDIYRDSDIKNPIHSDIVLEINASEEMRMDKIESVKQFVFSSSMNPHVTYKFVILDEADNMSRDVQTALRRIIETVPPNVKFILTCNYIERIIDPIVSRCSIFRFPPLSRDHVIERITHIVKNERFNITDSAIEYLYEITRGDMRSAINSLQSISILNNGNISEEIIADFFGILDPKTLDRFIDGIINDDPHTILSIISSFQEIYPRHFFKQILKKIETMNVEEEKMKLIWKAIAESDIQITEKGNETFQVMGIGGKLYKIMRGA